MNRHVISELVREVFGGDPDAARCPICGTELDLSVELDDELDPHVVTLRATPVGHDYFEWQAECEPVFVRHALVLLKQAIAVSCREPNEKDSRPSINCEPRGRPSGLADASALRTQR